MYASVKLGLELLFPFTEFGAVARTYPVACSGVRQRNFDLDLMFGKISSLYLN